MDVAPHQIAEGREHHALALDAALAGEGGRDNRQPEVTLAFRARPGMAGVARGVVDQLEPGRRQRGGQPLADGRGNAHGGSPFRTGIDWVSRMSIAQSRDSTKASRDTCPTMRVMVAVDQRRVTSLAQVQARNRRIRSDLFSLYDLEIS
jgi:hypothetical protein